jgi:phage minor structural protein
MIFILNKKESVVGVLDNSAPFACPYFDDKHVENIETGVHYYEFSVPASHETAGKLEEEGYVIIRDLDNKMQMFKIKNIEENSTADGYIKRIHAEHIAIPELLSDVVRPVFLASTTLENALNYVLQGTEYEAGEVDYLGSKDINLKDYVTVLEAIHIIAEAFDAEIQFEVVFEHGEVKKRLVHITKQRGTVTKKLFTYRKDLVEVKRTVDTEGLVTALIGIGKGDSDGNPLTLVGYTSSLPAGYSKPPEVDYIANEDAVQLYGKNGKHIFGVYRDDNATNKEVLFDNTLKELQIRSKPKVTYECKVTTLERITGYESEKVRVGDTVIVQDLTFVPELVLEARVIELTRSYTNPENDEVVLGDYRPIKITTSVTIQKLQNIIAQNEAKWAEGGLGEDEVTVIVDERITPVQQIAENAQTTAQTAQTVAQNAQAVAQTAQQIAEQADSKADQAQADATNALQEVQLREIAIPRQPTAPANPQVNDLWIDTNENRLKQWTGTEWKVLAPTNPSEIGAISVSEFDSTVQQLQSDISGKADASNVYTKTEVDNALNGKVSVDTYTTDKNGILQRLDTTESTLTQHANEIATKVSQTTYDVDINASGTGLKARMSSAESTISQHSNEINLRVRKDSIISEINQTAEQIKISASKIALDGYVEARHIKSLNGLNINNKFIVDQNGNVTFAGTLNGANGTFNGMVEVIYNPTPDETHTVRLVEGNVSSNYHYEDSVLGYTIDKSAILTNGGLELYYADVGYELGGEARANIYNDRGRVQFENYDGGLDIYVTDMHISCDVEIYGNIALLAGKGIDSTYMGGRNIIRDHNNGNITVSAVGGDLFLGYWNTNYIKSQKEHWLMAGARVKAGSLIVEAGDLDASAGIVKGGAFKFTSISSTPTSGDGALWYGNGFSGKQLYLYKGTGWVVVQ